MNIKRCDRCGEEIRHNGNWLDAISEAVEQIGNTLTGKPNIKLFNTNNGEELDLCENCRASLIKWMKYGQAIQKAKNSVEPDAIIRDGKRYKLEKETDPEEDQKPKVRKAYIIPEPEELHFGDF